MLTQRIYAKEKADLVFDYLKHITTLSTGSIVLLTVFMERLFPNPEWKSLVGISLGAFMTSVVSATIAMVMIISLVDEEVLGRSWEEYSGAISLLLTWIGFLVGVLTLVIFALKNIF